MSILDKAIAAITPPESDEARAEARQKAQAAAGQNDWLAMVLDHHRQIESAFAEARSAAGAAERRVAFRQLAEILTGHANAEEAVLYPQLADAGEKAEAMMGYEEQAMVKVQMAKLEMLDPTSQAWLDKLEHIRGAVLHHMYQEESDWLLALRQCAPDQEMLTVRYREEFSRYIDGGKIAGGGQPAIRAETATLRPNDSAF